MASVQWIGKNTLTFTNVANGVPFVDILNTELDSMVVILPSLTTIYQMESLDKIIYRQTIGSTTIQKNYVIDNVNIEQITFDGTIKYKYTINCVSPEKMLQGIVLPNKTITQIIGYTRTCYNAMEKLRQLYCPNLSFSNNLEILLASKPYPEMQWNRNTLFEVFNSLLSIFGCCVKMYNFTTIDYINLSESGNAVDTTKLSTRERNMSSKNYASNIDIELANSVSNIKNTMETVPLSPRHESGIITTDNCKFMLPKPIYELERVNLVEETEIWIHYYTGTEETYTIDELDITKQVIEQSLYNLKKVATDTHILDDGEERKRNYFYYTIGDNSIDGLTYQERTLLGANAPPAYRCVITYAAIQYLLDNNLIENPERLDESLGTYFTVHLGGVAIDVRNILIRATFVSQDNSRFKVYKSIAPQNEYTQIDGQQDSFVDANYFGSREESIVNSMANTEEYRTGKLKSISDLEALGNYITVGTRKLVLWKREYSMYDDFILFKYYFSENYPNQNLNTLLTQRKRYTQIADASESMLRNELISKKFQFSRRSDGSTNIANYMMKINVRDIRNKHICRTVFLDSTKSHYFILNSINMKIGKSVLCTMKFLDNYAVGLKIDSVANAGGYTEKQVPYTDNYGEATSIEINFGAFEEANALYEEDYSLLEISRAYPETMDNNPSLDDAIDEFDMLLYKDNREQLQLNMQFSFINNDDGIIYDGFIELNPLIKERVETLQVFESNTQYIGNETAVMGTVNNNAVIQINNNRLTINNLSTGKLGIAIAYVKNNQTHIVCAFNKLSSVTQIVRWLVEF